MKITALSRYIVFDNQRCPFPEVNQFMTPIVTSFVYNQLAKMIKKKPNSLCMNLPQNIPRAKLNGFYDTVDLKLSRLVVSVSMST